LLFHNIEIIFKTYLQSYEAKNRKPRKRRSNILTQKTSVTFIGAVCYKGHLTFIEKHIKKRFMQITLNCGLKRGFYE